MSPHPISPEELQGLAADSYQMIDVREPVEFAAERLGNAVLFPLGTLPHAADHLDRSRPVVVTCQRGRRGAEACILLEKAGFTHVRNLEGGMDGWKSAGLPVQRGSAKRLPLMQQVQITIGVGVLAGVLLAHWVDPAWIWLSGFFGAGLIFAGTTGWCGLALLLARMPWNRVG